MNYLTNQREKTTDNVHCGLQDKAGNLWFGTTGDGVYRYDGRSFIHFTTKEGLNSNRVWCMLEDKTGNIWFGTDAGICRYDGKTFSAIPIPALRDLPVYSQRPSNPNSSAKNEVWSMLQDKTGKIWFGASDGVYCYSGGSFTRFPQNGDALNKEGHPLKMIVDMWEDKKGNIWFASWEREGAFRYDPAKDRVIHFMPQDGLGDDMISGISEDKTSNILFVTRDKGVWQYDGKFFSNFSEKLGLPNNNIRCMLEDKNGNIWFGTDGKGGNDGDGVYRYDGRSFTRFSTKDGLSDNNVFTILEDKAGNLWFGTRNMGLCRYDGKSFTAFTR